MLGNIRILLVETSNPGNIGSTARAMKTMGLTNLNLVNPIIKLDAHAISMAASARDVLENASLFHTLDDAINDCSLVIGTSARERTLPWPMIEPRESAFHLIRAAEFAPVALIFGRERTGLTNDELQKCHYHVVIPTNLEYSSLNLAMAVQILAYEVRIAYLSYHRVETVPKIEVIYPSRNDLECFYIHLQKTLQYTGFINKNRPRQIMDRLRRLFTRARLEDRELSILRGILSSIEKQSRHEKQVS